MKSSGFILLTQRSVASPSLARIPKSAFPSPRSQGAGGGEAALRPGRAEEVEEFGEQVVMISGSSAVTTSPAPREGFGAGLALSGHGSTSASPVSPVGCRFPPCQGVWGWE